MSSENENITIVVEGTTLDGKTDEPIKELFKEYIRDDVNNDDYPPPEKKRRGRPRKQRSSSMIPSDSDGDWNLKDDNDKDIDYDNHTPKPRKRRVKREIEDEEYDDDDPDTEPGSGKKKSYMQKYKKEWENLPQFKNWVTESLMGPFYFFCKICKNDNRCGKTGIARHMACQKHIRNMELNNKKKNAFEGLICPVFAPFEKVKNRELEVKYSTIFRYAEFLKACDVDAVLVHDIIGEGMSLTTPERTSITEHWIKAREETKQHIMVQVGGAPFKEVIRMVRHCVTHKADSLLVLPDMFCRPDDHYDLLRYLKTISVYAQNIPLWYYHKPKYTNVTIDIMKLLTDIGEIDTFVGIIFDSGNLEEAISIMHMFPKYLISVCTNEGILGAFANGIKSIVGVSLNFMPKIVQDIKKMTKDGKLIEAQESQKFLNKSFGIIKEKGNFISAMKCTMNILTKVKVGGVREPLVGIWDNTAKNMEAEFKQLGIL